MAKESIKIYVLIFTTIGLLFPTEARAEGRLRSMLSRIMMVAPTLLSPPPNEVRFRNTSTDFGSIEEDSTLDKRITIKNYGNVKVKKISFATTGTGFSIKGDNCPNQLDDGDSCDVTVTFAPMNAGSFGGTVAVTYCLPLDEKKGCGATLRPGDVMKTSTATLEGTATAKPGVIAVSTNAMNFGTVTVGNTDEQILTLSNTGGSSLNVTSISASAPFTSTTCGSIAAGANCAVTVRFTPTQNESYTVTLTVNSNRGNVTVSLMGQGSVPPPVVTPTPTPTPTAGPMSYVAKASTALSDGRIIVAGVANDGSKNRGFLMRFLTSGGKDTSFGTNGVVVSEFAGRNDSFNAIALDAAGNIVVAGSSYNATNKDMAVGRFLPNGSMDTSFANVGWTVMNLGADDAANAVAVTTDNKIVIAGQTMMAGDLDFAVARFTSSGAVDTTFHSSGSNTMDFGYGDDVANAVSVNSDGQVSLAGSAKDDGGRKLMAMARFTSQGEWDTYFNGGGMVLSSLSGDSEATSLLFDGTGWLMIGTRVEGEERYGMVSKVMPYGYSDSWFGMDGMTQVSYSEHQLAGISGAIDENGNIYLVGTAVSLDNTHSSFVSRVSSSGGLDIAFGNWGTRVSDPAEGQQDGVGIHLYNGNVNVVSTTVGVALSDVMVGSFTP